jgi:hypothetical protein
VEKPSRKHFRRDSELRKDLRDRNAVVDIRFPRCPLLAAMSLLRRSVSTPNQIFVSERVGRR